MIIKENNFITEEQENIDKVFSLVSVELDLPAGYSFKVATDEVCIFKEPKNFWDGAIKIAVVTKESEDILQIRFYDNESYEVFKNILASSNINFHSIIKKEEEYY